MKTNNNILFSIIVPIYNAEKYLDECIKSVLNQRVDDWELILVDDGSTDGSADICDRYSNLDSRITVIHKENGGEFSSRLAAVNIAKGKYVTGLDADDYYACDYLETIKNILNEKDYDCVMWSFTQFGERNGIIQLDKNSIKEYSGEEYVYHIVKTTLHSFCSKVIKLSLLKAVDFSKIPKVRMSEDYIMVIPAICGVKFARIIDYYGYMYRIHSDSASQSVNYQKIYDLCEVSKFGLRTLKENGYGGKKFLAAEHKAFIQCTFPRIIEAVKQDKITEAEMEVIWAHPAYKMSETIENADNYKGRYYEFMKLFRNHQFHEFVTLVKSY